MALTSVRSGGIIGMLISGQLVLRDRARLSYALDGCRDNTQMESFHSRFKTENRSLLLDAASLAELERVGQRIDYYNRRRPYSASETRRIQ